MLQCDLLRFVAEWRREPLRVAAIAPSSDALARLITSEISAASAPVIELGPGTGAFTRALLARGVPENQLALIEIGSDFARLLAHRFPHATVRWMDAARLGEVALVPGAWAGAVVSGLPLLSMSPRKVLAILDGAFAQMRDGGAFYQFTYGPRCPVSRTLLDRLGLKAIRIGSTFANLPPASVYRIRRRSARRLSAPPQSDAARNEGEIRQ
ncbi:hypothetical protein [Terrarubrum flagellatum]|uniref:class I SAM-dependent methyltransferase n=1 Tax=Terrirubrum flagellatum TaxID=2895980 RepID=UPI0031454445